jgi:nitrogenase-associated protein
MAEVQFFEKSGCRGNAKQKAWLQAAGHTVIAHDLRRAAWTPKTLLAFLADVPVADWFNRNAPSVKSGEVVPESFDQASALARLIAEPLLIRRPLLQVGEQRRVGFDAAAIDAWIGLPGVPTDENLEACSHSHEHDAGRCGA